LCRIVQPISAANLYEKLFQPLLDLFLLFAKGRVSCRIISVESHPSSKTLVNNDDTPIWQQSIIDVDHCHLPGLVISLLGGEALVASKRAFSLGVSDPSVQRGRSSKWTLRPSSSGGSLCADGERHKCGSSFRLGVPDPQRASSGLSALCKANICLHGDTTTCVLRHQYISHSQSNPRKQNGT
jgi:hypothetical protein